MAIKHLFVSDHSE